jgi:hypothetical protein
MAGRKRTKPATSDPVDGLGPSAGSRAGTDEGSAEELAPRLSVQLNADGTIAWDRVQTKNRERLRVALGDPTIAAQLGVSPVHVAAAPSAEQMDPAVVNVLYLGIGSILVGVARAAGYPDDQAAGLQFTPSEVKNLEGPTAKVLAKYASALGKYEDEIMLGFVLTSVVGSKVAALKKPATITEFPREVPKPDSQPQTLE